MISCSNPIISFNSFASFVGELGTDMMLMFLLLLPDQSIFFSSYPISLCIRPCLSICLFILKDITRRYCLQAHQAASSFSISCLPSIVYVYFLFLASSCPVSISFQDKTKRNLMTVFPHRIHAACEYQEKEETAE